LRGKTRPRSTRIAVLLLCCSGLRACGGGPADQGPAAETVRTFYEHLNQGRYAEAKTLYSEATRQQIFPDFSADAGFREWAAIETHDGGLEAFKVVSEAELEGMVTIEFELRFSDGETARRTVTLREEDGLWRLGVIG